MSSTAKHFDMLDFVKKSKALGVNEELAEYQARQLGEVIDFASAAAREEFNLHELATKTDIKQLEKEIKQLDVKITQLEVSLKELDANSKRLELKVEQYRFDSIKTIIWTGVSVVVFLTGTLGSLIAKGFHWFG